MAIHTHTKDDLTRLQPLHTSFVGIDSDGCIFDTMEIKQKQCFHPLIISMWNLEAIAPYVRDAAEFVNLYSKWRGTNRFIALDRMFDLLRRRKEVIDSGVKLPGFEPVKKFLTSGVPLSNPGLEQAVRDTGDRELAGLLQWSLAINDAVARKVKKIPPFKWVRESLDKIIAHSDMICVSQTPAEALIREWEENHLMGYPALIAGQEMGTKTDHLTLATKGKYKPDRILMIGDAQGDLKAARETGARFYPINPAHEPESWERFYNEAFDRFLAGTYSGNYEQRLIDDFNALLPEKPAWED